MSQLSFFNVAPKPENEPPRALRERVKRIAWLRAGLVEAVLQTEWHLNHVDEIGWFIDRDGRFDPHVWQCFVRTFGNLEFDDDEELERSDYIDCDPAIRWWAGENVPIRMTRMEREYLSDVRASLLSDIDSIREGAAAFRNELIRLVAIGPIPQEKKVAA